jgi:hypothetical protein
MKAVFADTFYFLALLNPSDNAHARSVAFTAGEPFRLLTTEWVPVELADALAHTNTGRAEFLSMLSELQRDSEAAIVACESALMARGADLYGRPLDKQCSLTDCISFLVMEERGITEALTGDRHLSNPDSSLH